jgi:transcriptional regulator with XRE-family HTH domain
MKNYTEFGIKVRAELLRRDMTITDLANQLGICSMYLSDILRGNRGKRKGQMYRDQITQILNITE